MDPVLLRIVLVVGIVAVVAAVGRWWRGRDGALRHPRDAALDPHHLDAVGLDLSDADAGAVLLGSSTCTPCEGVKDVLGALQSERPGFRWVYADAAEHLDLAEAYRILRIPTLLVVGRDGRIVARSSGVPRVDDLRRLLDGGAQLDGSFAA